MRLPSRIPATIEIQARRGARSRPSRSCSRATRSAACDAGSRISTATSCCPSCSARSHCTTSAPWRTVSRGARAPARSPRRPRSRVKVAPRLRSQALQRLLDRRGHRTAARDRAAQDRAPDRARLDLPRGQRPPLHHRGRARAVRLHAQLARARGTARNRRPRPHPARRKARLRPAARHRPCTSAARRECGGDGARARILCAMFAACAAPTAHPRPCRFVQERRKARTAGRVVAGVASARMVRVGAPQGANRGAQNGRRPRRTAVFAAAAAPAGRVVAVAAWSADPQDPERSGGRYSGFAPTSARASAAPISTRAASSRAKWRRCAAGPGSRRGIV
jgi:hypothetical protein